MSASWLQFGAAIIGMYAVVAAAGYWAQRRRRQQGHPTKRTNHKTRK